MCYMYILYYMYNYIYIYMYNTLVGVNMVLAEFIEFKHGLYKSCGINVSHGYYARTHVRLESNIISNNVLYYNII